MAISCMHNEKYANVTVTYGDITEITTSYRKSGSRNTIVMWRSLSVAFLLTA